MRFVSSFCFQNFVFVRSESPLLEGLHGCADAAEFRLVGIGGEEHSGGEIQRIMFAAVTRIMVLMRVTWRK